MKDLTRAIAYFRQSSVGQAEYGNTNENYIKRFIKYGFRRDQILYETASGGDDNRVVYRSILQMIKDGKIDMVVIPEITRFSRSIVGFEEALEYFQITGVDLVTLDGHRFRFDTPQDRTNVRMMILFAQQEREINKHRAIRGHIELREQGKALKSTFPYLINDGKLYPNSNQYKLTNSTVWEVGKDVIKVYLEVKSINGTINTLCSKYGVKRNGSKSYEDFPRSDSGFRKWLLSELIRGNIEYFNNCYKPGTHIIDKNQRGEIIVGTHEPLITPDVSNEIEALIADGGKRYSKLNTTRNLFIGYLNCDKCGSRMKARDGRRKLANGTFSRRYYLICEEALPTRDTVRREIKEGTYTPKCNQRRSYGLTTKKLEELAIQALCQRAKELATYTFDEIDTDELPEEVIQLNNQIAKYERLLSMDEDPELRVLLNKKITRRDYLLEKSKSKTPEEMMGDRQELMKYGQDIEYWQEMTKEEKIKMFKFYFEEIRCKEGVPLFKFRI